MDKPGLKVLSDMLRKALAQLIPPFTDLKQDCSPMFCTLCRRTVAEQRYSSRTNKTWQVANMRAAAYASAREAVLQMKYASEAVSQMH